MAMQGPAPGQVMVLSELFLKLLPRVLFRYLFLLCLSDLLNSILTQLRGVDRMTMALFSGSPNLGW